MTKFDPLHMVGDPPPTFRALDERHHAQYRDTLHVVGRLHNFEKRIAILKEERLEMTEKRSFYEQVLDSIHVDVLRSNNVVLDLEVIMMLLFAL